MNGAASKPEYCVPTMGEIGAMPLSGLRAVSTFSGCGGSSLGYRMAGFKVLWANEFVPAAQEVYQLNFPDALLDPRDIREIQPEEVLQALGLAAGELDLMDGSPPCASFSTAGKHQASWGRVRKYSDTAQRVDDLFFEYVRLLRGIQPKVFVAENVSGLIKGVSKGYFKEILVALKDCGYNVRARVLDAQWLGVPQSRQRLFFVGVRDDLAAEPAFPKPLPYRYTLREALPWIAEHGVYPPGTFRPRFADSGKGPAPAILTSVSSGAGLVRVIHDTSGIYGTGDVTDRPCPAIMVGVRSLCSEHFKVVRPAEDEGHDTDISRFAIGEQWRKLRPGEKGRYLNFVKPKLDVPCPTVTQTVGNLGAASVTHPLECRKFTISELKRVCGFPDDFVLTGTYAQQWERLGRAVPPVMMRRVAEVIRDDIFGRL